MNNFLRDDGLDGGGGGLSHLCSLGMGLLVQWTHLVALVVPHLQVQTAYWY